MPDIRHQIDEEQPDTGPDMYTDWEASETSSTEEPVAAAVDVERLGELEPTRPWYAHLGGLGLGLLLFIAAGTYAYAVALNRWKVLIPTATLLFGEASMSDVPLLDYTIGALLGPGSTFAVAFALVVALGIIMAETITFHLLGELGRKISRWRLLGTQGERVLTGDPATLEVCLWKARDELGRTAVMSAFCVALTGGIMTFDYHATAARVVAVSTLKAAESSMDMEEPQLEDMLHPGVFLDPERFPLRDEQGQPVAPEPSLFPLAIRLAAWSEILLLGIIPSLVLALGTAFLSSKSRAFFVAFWEMLGPMNRAVGRLWRGAWGEAPMEQPLDEEPSEHLEAAELPELESTLADEDTLNPPPRSEARSGHDVAWVGDDRWFCSCGLTGEAGELDEHLAGERASWDAHAIPQEQHA